MRNGRFVGAALGVGVVAGAALLLSRSAAASELGSPREREFSRPPRPSPFPPGVFPPLVERWRGEVAKRAKDLPVDSLLEWIRIESGGDTCSVGTSREAGIFQLNFPDDAKFGASLAGLRAICQKSKTAPRPYDVTSWLSEAELDMEVGAGIRKILASRDVVRHVFALNGVTWPETSFDFGSSVKQIHATPAVITELISKITRRDGRPPASWDDLRRSVLAFPVSQMGSGLRVLALAPSRKGLKNRLDDTMDNAELVGHVWAAASAKEAYA